MTLDASQMPVTSDLPVEGITVQVDEGKGLTGGSCGVDTDLWLLCRLV